MIRLMRRTLLCLVVGVTAFGAAGWMLRPRPTWVIEVASESPPDLVAPAKENVSPDAPVWVFLDAAGDSDAHTVQARSSADGRLLAETSAPRYPSPVVLKSGTLLTTEYKLLGTVAASTTFRFHDPADKEHARAVSLPGRWDASPDGDRAGGVRGDTYGPFAFLVGPSGRGLVLSVADLATGRIERSRTYPECIVINEEAVVFSPDLRWAAVSEEYVHSRVKNRGVQVFDMETGAHRATKPATESGAAHQALDLHFDHQSCLYFHWQDPRAGGGETWRLDLRTDRLDPFPRHPPAVAPHEGNPTYEVHFNRAPPGRIWYEVSGEDGDASYLIERDDALATWRRFPFPLIRNAEAPAWRLVEFQKVPGRDEYVVRSREQALTATLPEKADSLLPIGWRRPATRTRLYRPTRGEWLNVGLVEESKTEQVRTDAVVAVTTVGEGRFTLQSWPLPPRDPKPPALAIAALCMAGTWWVCAWRYKRRMRVAAGGAT